MPNCCHLAWDTKPLVCLVGKIYTPKRKYAALWGERTATEKESTFILLLFCANHFAFRSGPVCVCVFSFPNFCGIFFLLP